MENFVLVIQIRIAERTKEYLVLVDSKNEKEGRKTFFSKTKNKNWKEEYARWGRFMYGIAPLNLSYMGSRDTGYMPIHWSEYLTVLCLFVHLLVPVRIKLYRL